MLNALTFIWISFDFWEEIMELDDYISTEALYWRNVQEPSTRVKDVRLLSLLAIRSLDKYENNKLIRVSATVNLLYRSIEDTWDPSLFSNDLLSFSESLLENLSPENGFLECRWFLSLILAQAAKKLFLGDKLGARNTILSMRSASLIAFSHGQLFTNIVKGCLLEATINASLDKGGNEDTVEYIKSLLVFSNIIPVNYKFSNQWAYEEVAYVYTMLREVYKLSDLMERGYKTLSDLSLNGYRWQVVGAPFKNLIL